jgi:hypothetical protein
MSIEGWKQTYEETDGTFYSSPIYGSFRELRNLLLCAGPLAMGPEGRTNVRFGRWGSRCGLAVARGFWILRKFLTRGEDLLVVPGLIVFFQGPVEGSKLALDD